MSKSQWAVAFICCVAGCDSTGPGSGQRDATPSPDARDSRAFSASGGSTSAPGSGGSAAVGSGGATAGSGGSSGTGGAAGADAGTIGTGGNVGNGGTSAVGGTLGRGGVIGTGGSSHATGGALPGTGGSSHATGGSQSSGGTFNTGGNKSTGGSPSTGGSTGTGGTQSTGGSTGCYTAPAEPIGTQAPGGSVSGNGTVRIWAKSPRQIVRLQTKLVVPPKPPASGTLFLWPGLQPDGVNFDPIDNGVLQPVLTWGPSCAPGKAPRSYSTWWISGQYVNTNGQVSGYTGCDGGPIMSVNVCDTLDIDMALSGTVWTQTVTDEQTNQSVTYSIDMKGQAQNLAYFVIEEYSSAPVSEVIFTDTILTFDSSDATDCKVSMRGQTDFVSSPVASGDGLQCSIPQLILRAQGIQ
jgi:hypothetical protein